MGGLSRYTYGQSFPTKILGTITHMPPELLRLEDPVLVPEADVWAFGVVAWEAYHGGCCYHLKMAPQIVIAVLMGKQLEWSAEAPNDFVSLMKQCLMYEYTQRSAFSAVVDGLQAIGSIDR